MSKKLKGIGCLIMALLSAFTYGAYTYRSLHGREIEPIYMVLTGLFGFMWCVLAVKFLSDKD